jgi:hypothetical protein
MRRGGDHGRVTTVDVVADGGTVRGRVTAVDEPGGTVSVQPVDADGNDVADAPLSVAPAAVTVVTPAPVEAAPSGSLRTPEPGRRSSPLAAPAGWGAGGRCGAATTPTGSGSTPSP